jgi:hypothetical protein
MAWDRFKRFFIAALAIGGTPGSPFAAQDTLAVQVESAAGGQVDGLPSDGSCRSRCTARLNRSSLISLLAQPDPGFRFDAWQGDCDATLGPLCTLAEPAQASVSVRFVPEDETRVPVESVLLLHGPEQDASVWNAVVRRQFAGDCPVIYGGALLTREREFNRAGLRCFRIRFGYYDALKPLAAFGGTPAGGFPEIWELRAAVAGLMDRYPVLRLVLAGQPRALDIARRFAETPSRERHVVAGIFPVDGEPLKSAASPSAEGSVEPRAIRLRARQLLRRH